MSGTYPHGPVTQPEFPLLTGRKKNESNENELFAKKVIVLPKPELSDPDRQNEYTATGKLGRPLNSKHPPFTQRQTVYAYNSPRKHFSNLSRLFVMNMLSISLNVGPVKNSKLPHVIPVRNLKERHGHECLRVLKREK